MYLHTLGKTNDPKKERKKETEKKKKEKKKEKKGHRTPAVIGWRRSTRGSMTIHLGYKGHMVKPISRRRA